MVDDDPDLLRVSADRLRGLGYRVLTAGDGAEALAVLESKPAIRLLYTDIAMPPPWDGVALAQEALRRRPGLRILFTSGEHREIAEPSAPLLTKPVPMDRLAQAVGQLLDAVG